MGIGVLQCVSAGTQEVSYFDRAQAMAAMDAWRLSQLHALAASNSKDDAAAREADVVLQCEQGHTMKAVDILSRAVIYDAVPCPQCMHAGVVPPFCFNRRYCLLYFDEDNHGVPRAPAHACPHPAHSPPVCGAAVADCLEPGPRRGRWVQGGWGRWSAASAALQAAPPPSASSTSSLLRSCSARPGHSAITSASSAPTLADTDAAM